MVWCMEARQAAVNPVVEVLSGWVRGCTKAAGIVAPVAFSLPLLPLKSIRPFCQAVFSVQPSPLRVSAYLRLRACEHRRYARPLLISSYISRRCLPWRGWRSGRKGVVTYLVTRLFCAKLAVQAFCSSPPGGISLSSPLASSGAYSAALGLLSGQGFASPLRALDRASLRSSGALRRWLRGE